MVKPHRLRHTAATQLLNAACRVASIQKLLGHKSLNTTMAYARVHDRTVANDCHEAMEQVEKRLEVPGVSMDECLALGDGERGWLLAMAERMVEPNLDSQSRFGIAIQIRSLLLGSLVPEAWTG